VIKILSKDLFSLLKTKIFRQELFAVLPKMTLNNQLETIVI